MALRRAWAHTAGLTAAVLAGLALPAAASAPVTLPTPGPGFRSGSELTAVSVDSASDAWAIGQVEGSPLVMHWDGVAWGSVPVEVPDKDDVVLYGVEALSPTDVWVVGAAYTRSGQTVTLTEHWDGTAFTVVPSPNPGGLFASLAGISAVSGTDIWAVGGKDGPNAALAEHWDGTAWTVVAIPGGYFSDLSGVSAIAADDVWASGSDIDHWDGQRWTTVAAAEDGSYLKAVSSVSSSDVWAIGDSDAPGGIAEHWDGASWSYALGSCDAGGGFGGVTALPTGEVWIVGRCRGLVRRVDRSFVAYWNGTSWRKRRGPALGSGSGLSGVGASSVTDAWAVGYLYPRSSHLPRILIEHWDGTAWTIYPTTH